MRINPLFPASSQGNGGLPQLLLLLLALAPAASYQQHNNGAYHHPYHRPVETGAALDRRQTPGCIANTYSCENLGQQFAGICCANGQLCALDANNQPACCPAGAICTGAAPSSFVPPAATTAPVSYVSNTLFPFAYITTSFPGESDCSRAVSQCSRNYDTCNSQLQGLGGNGQQGSAYGVTIVVSGGGGTTVAPATRTSLPATQATSVCSSLSREACFGIQPAICTFRGQQGVFYIGSANAAAAARPTPPPAVVRNLVPAAVAIGAGLGVMGAM